MTVNNMNDDVLGIAGLFFGLLGMIMSNSVFFFVGILCFILALAVKLRPTESK